ncbi:MAG: biotin/lipoyl-containing protein, partial [Dehalococcoidia bacterium]
MATAILMPQLGMIMTEGTLAKWFKKPGDTVQQGEPLAEITTEKITYELEAPASGLFHPVVTEGDVVPVEELIAHILADGEEPPETPKPKAVSAEQPRLVAPQRQFRASAPEGVRAAPSARRLAAELGIDISQVPPSRPGTRIVEANVRAFAEEAEEKSSAPALPGLPSPTQVEPLQGIRRIIAERMRESVANAAQLSFHLDVDMTEATRLRRQL